MYLRRYHNVSANLENKLILYLKTHPNVIEVVKTLGEWDIEIHLEAPSSIDLRKIEMEIRQKFGLLIQRIETVPLYKTYKLNYFPSFLLE